MTKDELDEMAQELRRLYARHGTVRKDGIEGQVQTFDLWLNEIARLAYEDGCDDGYEAGFRAGHDDGYDVGYELGHTDAERGL